MLDKIKLLIDAIALKLQKAWDAIPLNTSDLVNDGEGSDKFAQEGKIKTVNGNSLIGTGNIAITSDATIPDYADITDLLANQGIQVDEGIYGVEDATADTNINFEVGETRLQAYYQFLGTATGSIDDYRLVSAPYGNHTNTKPLVTADTGTEITLYPFGNFCNSASPNLEDTAFTFVLTNEDAPAGEMATVLIKTDSGASDFPVVTGAEYVEGAPFAVDSYYDLYLWHNGAIVAYTFLSRSAPPPWIIIPELIEPVGTLDETPKAWKSPVPTDFSFGTGTFERTSGSGAMDIWFGELTNSDYPLITSYGVSFIFVSKGSSFINVGASGGNPAILGTPADVAMQFFGTNLRVRYPDSTNTVVQTIPIVSGQKVEYILEQGKLQVYVDDVLEYELIDVGITYSKIMTGIYCVDSGSELTDIKQTMYTS